MTALLPLRATAEEVGSEGLTAAGEGRQWLRCSRWPAGWHRAVVG